MSADRSISALDRFEAALDRAERASQAIAAKRASHARLRAEVKAVLGELDRMLEAGPDADRGSGE